MSDPQRFDCLSDGMWQNSAGDYVLHSDYARLKAEVERLRASSFVTAVPVEQYERLVKAGDAMALSLANGDRMEYGDHDEPIEEYMNRKEIADWNAAKEGKQP
jgi:hypothetical protein